MIILLPFAGLTLLGLTHARPTEPAQRRECPGPEIATPVMTFDISSDFLWFAGTVDAASIFHSIMQASNATLFSPLHQDPHTGLEAHSRNITTVDAIFDSPCRLTLTTTRSVRISHLAMLQGLVAALNSTDALFASAPPPGTQPRVGLGGAYTLLPRGFQMAQLRTFADSGEDAGARLAIECPDAEPAASVEPAELAAVRPVSRKTDCVWCRSVAAQLRGACAAWGRSADATGSQLDRWLAANGNWTVMDAVCVGCPLELPPGVDGTTGLEGGEPVDFGLGEAEVFPGPDVDVGGEVELSPVVGGQ